MPPVLISISGISFELSPPYEPGHQCSPAEAAVLNQAWVDNIRTNFGKRLTAGGLSALVEAEDNPALQQEFAAYVAGYEFKSSGPRSIGDPVLREASKIAKARVLAHLNFRNVSRESLSDEKFDQMVSTVANHPIVLDEAKRRIESVSAVAGELLS